MKHVHAELMALYAQDAMESETPWDKWEADIGNRWIPLTEHPRWHIEHQYRRKKDMIKVGKLEFPRPLSRVLPGQDIYYTIAITNWSENYCEIHRSSSSFEKLLRLGRIHSCKEDAMTHADVEIAISRGEF